MTAGGIAALGLVLLIVGFLVHIAIVWELGVAALVVALIVLLAVSLRAPRNNRL